MAITNVLVPESENQDNGQYVKCFLYFERILEQTVDTRDRYIHGVITKKSRKMWMQRQRKYLVPLIRRKMRISAEEEGAEKEIPKYIQQLFNYFCDRKSTVNLSCIRKEIEFMDQSLKRILWTVSEDEEEVLNVDTLRVILPNLVSYIDENRVDVALSPR